MGRHSRENETPPGFPAGNRTERPHAEDGWQTGGRRDDDQPYDPALAEQHRQAHDDRTK